MNTAPLGIAAEGIDPNLLATLASWRGLDGHNLLDLNAALSTHAGAFADTSAYLTESHPFAAAAIVHEHVASMHDGVHAAALVHEAMKGVPQLSVLTALLAALHAWERVDEGRLNVPTAIRTGAVDVGVQGLGIALGAKLAAAGIVALGAFPLAIVAIPAGAITGALMLRRKLTERREVTLDSALATFESIRVAAESAARTWVALARTEVAAAADAGIAALRADVSVLRTAWSEAVTAAIDQVEADLVVLARGIEAAAEPAQRHAVGRVIADALAKSEHVTRLAALDAALAHALPAVLPERHERLGAQLDRIRKDYRERCVTLTQMQTQLGNAVRVASERERQSFSLATARAYASLLERAAHVRGHVLAAFIVVDRELAKLNRGPSPLVTDA